MTIRLKYILWVGIQRETFKEYYRKILLKKYFENGMKML